MVTANLLVDSEIKTEFDTLVGAATHWEAVDEGTTLGGNSPNDSDYVETPTVDDQDRFGFVASAGNLDECTQLDLNTRGVITDGSSNARLQVDLFHTTTTPVTGNPKFITGANFGGYGVTGEFALSWVTLTLTKAEVDSLEAEYTKLDA